MGVLINKNNPTLVSMGGDGGSDPSKVIVEKVTDPETGIVCMIAKSANKDSRNSPSISCVAPPAVDLGKIRQRDSEPGVVEAPKPKR